MARPKKHPGVTVKSVTFSIPEAEVDAIDARAAEMSAQLNISVTRTDAFRHVLAAGLVALAAGAGSSTEARAQ